MKTLHSRSGGFTLIEALIVMLITSVVMMAALSMVTPIQRSASVQSQLVDVQGNLRMSMGIMAKDFRNAGVLYNGAPIVYNAVTPGSITINTRAVPARFAVIQSPPLAGGFIFTLSDSDQHRNFTAGSFVAVVNPISRALIDNKIFTVASVSNAGTVTLTESGSFEGLSSTLVMLQVPNTNLADVNRTIVYEHQDLDPNVPGADTLVRYVDKGKPHEVKQFFASNVTEVKFNPVMDADGDYDRVEFELTGATRAVGPANDAISSQKRETMRSVVALRNI